MTTREELAGDCHGRVDERRSPIDDNATYVLNDDAHPRRHLPASDGPSDEIDLNCGDEGCLAKSDSFIALIESGMFLGECIRRSLQSSAIPSFFVAANLQPQIRILISRYSSCESCGTGFCVTIIADEGVSFQKSRFRSLDLTLKGQKVPKSGHF